MKINVIVAYANNMVIGNNNQIPWNYQEDLAYFQKITSNTIDDKKNALIMGYHTYLSIPKKLKNRINIVITSKELSDKNTDDLFFVDGLGIAITLCRDMINENKVHNIFVIGGELIYEYFMNSYYYNYLDKVYITRIKKDYDGNKYFPSIGNQFYYIDIQQSIKHPEIEYRVLKYDRQFVNPEDKYYYYIHYILDKGIQTYNEKFMENEFQAHYFYMQLNLTHYFPIFSLPIKYINQLLADLLHLLKNDIIQGNLNEIVSKIKNNSKDKLFINLFDDEPYNSIYYFNYNEERISCTVTHRRGNIIIDVLYNIIFISLVLHIIGKMTGLKPYFVNYTCCEYYYLEGERTMLDNVLLNPSILPILKIVKDEVSIESIEINDIIIQGLDE
jgi:dihydrofolate reductase